MLAKFFGAAPRFLERAAVEENPLERLKLCFAFVMGASNLQAVM